jgi:heme-degrading monooxygenase HmoA
MHQSAYVSGETLIKVDDPTTYLVVGTWTRLEGWRVWENSQDRQELLQLVSVCLVDEPIVEVFTPATDDDDIFD